MFVDLVLSLLDVSQHGSELFGFRFDPCSFIIAVFFYFQADVLRDAFEGCFRWSLDQRSIYDQFSRLFELIVYVVRSLLPELVNLSFPSRTSTFFMVKKFTKSVSIPHDSPTFTNINIDAGRIVIH